MNESRRTKSPMKQSTKSNNFQKQPSLVRTTSSKQHRTSLPPSTPSPTRVNTMKPIDEKKVYHHPKPTPKRHHSRKLHNTLDDDIPLALLAYKKGYTTIYPSTATTKKDERTNSYLSTSSSGSSSQNSIIKLQETKRKKPRRHLSTTPVEVIEEPIIKEKKWYSSLRKLIK